LRYDLPGVFENNPYKGGVDGSLWTLYYEVFCYISVAVVGFLGFLATRAFTATLIVYFAVYTALRVHLGDSGSWGYTELTLPFALGVAIYVYRACVPLSAIMLGLLILSVILLRQTELYREAVVFTVAYGTFWAGLLKFPFIHHYNRMGDYSYGMYIFAFPIQQVLAMMMPGIAPWQMIAIAWPTTLVLAVLSWHLIENPVLMKRHVIGEFLNRRIRQVFTGNRHFRNSPPHLN
jgi:peptidoglycan/LPS O-acetylase OafA/YrhL